MNLQIIPLPDGVVTPCQVVDRQYTASGTGAADIYGSVDGTTLEKLCTLTVSASAASQVSSDRYPYVRATVTSGAPVCTLTGFLRS